jgi:hypothetical protein
VSQRQEFRNHENRKVGRISNLIFPNARHGTACNPIPCQPATMEWERGTGKELIAKRNLREQPISSSPLYSTSLEATTSTLSHSNYLGIYACLCCFCYSGLWSGSGIIIVLLSLSPSAKNCDCLWLGSLLLVLAVLWASKPPLHGDGGIQLSLLAQNHPLSISKPKPVEVHCRRLQKTETGLLPTITIVYIMQISA